MRPFCGDYSVNFHPIWTKNCIRSPHEMPNNNSARRYSAGCTSVEQLSLKKKLKKKRFFDQKTVILIQFSIFPSKTPVGFRSYNCHMEPYAKFQPNRAASFRDHKIFLHRSKIQMERHGSAPGALPTRSTSPKVKKTPASSCRRLIFPEYIFLP